VGTAFAEHLGVDPAPNVQRDVTRRESTEAVGQIVLTDQSKDKDQNADEEENSAIAE